MSAKLRFKYGAMGSAKTLQLLSTAYNFEEKGISFIVLKPSIDTRDGFNIVKSRAGLERECVSVQSNDNIYDYIKKLLELYKIEWILVDECQFLTPEQVEQLCHLVDKKGIEVLCYGLRTDFRSKLFDGSKRLFELADEIEEIKSRCSCGGKASINARIDDCGGLMSNGAQILIGGNDKYNPLCRKCWFESQGI